MGLLWLGLVFRYRGFCGNGFEILVTARNLIYKCPGYYFLIEIEDRREVMEK